MRTGYKDAETPSAPVGFDWAGVAFVAMACALAALPALTGPFVDRATFALHIANAVLAYEVLQRFGLRRWRLWGVALFALHPLSLGIAMTGPNVPALSFASLLLLVALLMARRYPNLSLRLDAPSTWGPLALVVGLALAGRWAGDWFWPRSLHITDPWFAPPLPAPWMAALTYAGSLVLSIGAALVADRVPWGSLRNIAWVIPALLIVVSWNESKSRATNEDFWLRAGLEKPKSVRVMAQLGTLRLNENRANDAIVPLVKAAFGESDLPEPEVRPIRDMAARNLSRALAKAGRLPEAADAMSRLLQRTPDFPGARYELASLYLGPLNRPDLAEPWLRQALTEPSTAVPAHLGLCRVYAANRARWNEAREHCEAAVKLAPQSGEARLQFANLLKQMGDLKGALVFYEGLASAVAPNEGLWLLIAQTRFDTGQIPTALEAVDRALALNPKNTDALALKVRIERKRPKL